MKLYRWLFTMGLIVTAIGLSIYSFSDMWDVKSLTGILFGIVLMMVALIRLDLRQVLGDRRDVRHQRLPRRARTGRGTSHGAAGMPG